MSILGTHGTCESFGARLEGDACTRASLRSSRFCHEPKAVVDLVGGWPHFVICFELALVGEALNGRAEELEALRFGLRFETALRRVIVCSRARNDIIIVTLKDIFHGGGGRRHGRLLNLLVLVITDSAFSHDHDPAGARS